MPTSNLKPSTTTPSLRCRVRLNIRPGTRAPDLTPCTGPEAAKVLTPFFEHALSLNTLRFGQAAIARYDAADLHVARSGYTGEDGFEVLSCPYLTGRRDTNDRTDLRTLLKGRLVYRRAVGDSADRSGGLGGEGQLATRSGTVPVRRRSGRGDESGRGRLGMGRRCVGSLSHVVIGC